MTQLATADRTTADSLDPDTSKGSGGDRWIRRLASYCWRFKGRLLIAFGAGIAGQTVMATIPLIQRQIIDRVILVRAEPLLPWAALLVLAAIVVFGFTYLRRFYGGRLSVDVQHEMRTDVFASLAKLDGARQDGLSTGQVVGRATSDLTLIQALLQMLPQLVGNLVLFTVSITVMFQLSPMLALIALATIPALWLLGLRSRAKLFPSSWFAQQTDAELAGAVEAATTGVRVVKGFGQEEQELNRVDRISQRLFGARFRTIRLNSIFTPALSAVPQLGTVGILALGGYLAIHGDLTLGTFLAFSTYVTQMAGPVRLLSLLLTTGQQARASVIRVLEMIDTRPVVTEKSDARPLRPGPGRIEFRDVGFGYDSDRPVLDGFSLTVEPGETLAIVGGSGCGKTTVSQLLPRFYDTWHGSVSIDGQDVRDVTLHSLRGAISIAMEESFLFSQSVGDNIAYGRPDAGRDQVEAAARAAHADGFISELPQGYDTVVGEQGLTLSGGQRQRVALARAILADPQILVLDDATSAIDARVEAEIHAALQQVLHGRTTLVMAHRRSTLQLADRIAVLDQGRIVDVGTLTELEQRSALFRTLLAGPDASEHDAQSEDGEVEAQITPELWDRSLVPGGAEDPALADRMSRIGAAGGRMGGGGGRGLSSGMASMPATAELLDAVEKLPAADARPEVDPEFARASDERFRLGNLMAKFRRPFAVGLGLVAADALCGLALPVLIRHGIDDGVSRGMTSAVWMASLLALVVVLLAWCIQMMAMRVTGRTGERFLYTLRVKIFSHLQRLGLDYYERELGGRIMTRMTTDVDALSSFLQTGLVTAMVSLLSFFGILIALCILNLQLMLVVGLVVPILAFTTFFFRRASSRSYRLAREQLSAVNADLQENVAGLRITQAFQRETFNADRFAGLSDQFRRTRTRSQRYISLYFPFVQFLSALAGALVLVLAATQFHSGLITAGGLIAYLLYIDLLFSPIQSLSQVFDGYQQAMVGLQRIRDLLSTPTSTPPPKRPVQLEQVRGQIDFCSVEFQYERASRPALDGLTVTIEPGQTVALVGETGAGKSTIVKLIERFYDVTDGSIRIDDHDLRQLELSTYRHHVGLVPQEGFLFPGNVRDQIAYGRPEADDAEVEAAARAVGAHLMISELPGGYLHPIAERGRNLSAGQRQLLALARAELVKPAILLLDEATAALDLRSEALVTRATERVAARRTTIVVAHRLTTAARADRILYIEHGRLAEDGTHDQLLALDGGYAGLWRTFIGDPDHSHL